MKIFKLKELDELKDAVLLAKCIKNYCVYCGHDRVCVSNKAIIRFTSECDIYFNDKGEIFKKIIF